MEWLQKTVEWLAANPWITLGGFVLTVIFGISGFVLYFLSRKEQEPCYSLWNLNLIHEGVREKLPDLEIHYRGTSETPKNVSVAKIRFWNAGREPIRKADLVRNEPITIAVKDGMILDVKIVQEKDQSNNYHITRSADKTVAILTFDHIAKDEGVVVQVIHTESGKQNVEVKGKLVNGKRPREVKRDSGVDAVFEGQCVGLMLTSVVTTIIMVAAGEFRGWMLPVLCLSIVAGCYGMRRFYWPRGPRGLESFDKW